MALQPLELRSAPVPRTRPIPAVLMPLVEAADCGIDLLPTMRSIVESFGFDSFLYGLSTSPRPDKEAQLYVFTTLPLEWLTIYDHKAYVELDPESSSCTTTRCLRFGSSERFVGSRAGSTNFWTMQRDSESAAAWRLLCTL